MQIAIISDFNIGGIPTFLMRAINKYTKHKARCIIAYDDSFAFDKDIILKGKPDGGKSQKEATEWVKGCDFFHFGRGIFGWPGFDPDTVLNKANCCVEYYGSELRNNHGFIRKWHEKTGVAAITGTDWTITGHLPNSFYHLGQYFTRFGDMDPADLPIAETWGGKGVFKIAIASAGSPIKGYDYLYQVIGDMVKEGIPVEIDHITGVSNQEVIERKLKCHATFTSLHGGWGMSGIESMFIGHPVICSLDPWTMSLYPNNPTVIVNRETLSVKIEGLIEGLMNCHFLSMDSIRFATENFNTKTILKRYLYLWDLIQNRDAVMNGGHLPTIIYDDF